MLLVVVTAALATLAAPTSAPLTTVAERSGFVRTGPHEEAVALCEAFANAHGKRVRCVRFGTSPEGRALVALVLSDDGLLTPEATRQANRPVVLVEAGIHAGEIDGKDAGFWFVRELLEGKVAPGALSAVTLLFVPIFNVDGHERSGKNHRPNQRGPEEMGWRTTSQNLNLNRDWMKADAPEMRAMLALIASWDPVLLADLHVTDGAQFRHDVAVLVEPLAAAGTGPAPLVSTGKSLSAALQQKLTQAGHLPLDFYPSFDEQDDPRSGFSVGAGPPRLSTPYWGLRNRLGILVETHSWHDYKARVRATRDFLVALLELSTRDAASWQKTVRAADTADEKRAGQSLALTWKNTEAQTTLSFLGYEYQRTLSPVSGGLRIRYDEKKPQVWSVPLRTGVAPALTATVPKAGWLIPAGPADKVRAVLAAHGVVARVVGAGRGRVGAFRASAVTFGAEPYEGRQTAKVQGAWRAEELAWPAGSLFVPAAQARVRVAAHLLEPQAPDSFVSWGFWNAHFEQKEYMEDYVAEDVALEMLKDPAVRQAFEEKLKDPTFASSPAARLNFFYERHPSHDARRNLIPVLQLDDAPPAVNDATAR